MDEKHKLLGNFENMLKFFDENSLEKLNFYFTFYFGKFFTKNRAFGNNTIFLQQFFRFRGGDFPPFPSWLRPCSAEDIPAGGYTPAYCSKNLTNRALIFFVFGRNRQFIGNFEKIFANFEKIS